FLIFTFYAIRKHGHTKRTAYRYSRCTCAYGFFSPFHVNVFSPWFRFLKHLGTSRSTTEASGPAALHFHQFDIKGSNDFPGSFIYIVRPAQEAAVMEGDLFTFKRSSALKHNFSVIDKLLKVFRMMNYFITATQGRIFIL